MEAIYSLIVDTLIAVNSVAGHHDGTRIVQQVSDDTVQVWDASDGGHVFIYRGHSRCDGVCTARWSPMEHASPQAAMTSLCTFGTLP